jgi:hypothetical protein
LDNLKGSKRSALKRRLLSAFQDTLKGSSRQRRIAAQLTM